ncbi:hypothetical protein V8G54_016980 [Vigna mungo]|uniref:Uncharacterized protein n=1 Tax=Vigna mungo TaxID=3915 RepID=A0AAQ3NL44_VIGMU
MRLAHLVPPVIVLRLRQILPAVIHLTHRIRRRSGRPRAHSLVTTAAHPPREVELERSHRRDALLLEHDVVARRLPREPHAVPVPLPALVRTPRNDAVRQIALPLHQNRRRSHLFHFPPKSEPKIGKGSPNWNSTKSKPLSTEGINEKKKQK